MSDAAAQMQAIRQMLETQGVPMTAENMNRASLHMARGDDNAASPVFEKAMAAQVNNPSTTQVRKAAAQSENVSRKLPVPDVSEGGSDGAGVAAPSVVVRGAPQNNPPAPAGAAVGDTGNGVPTLSSATGGPATTVDGTDIVRNAAAYAIPTLTAVLLGRRGKGSADDAASALRGKLGGSTTPNTTPVDVRPNATVTEPTTFGRRETPYVTPPQQYGPSINHIGTVTGPDGLPRVLNRDTLQREGNAHVVEALRDNTARERLRAYDNQQTAARQGPKATEEAEREGRRFTRIDTKGGTRSFEEARDARRRAATAGRRRRAED